MPFSGPSRAITIAMFSIAWPDCRRRSHMSLESLNSPSLADGLRTPREPIEWQDWQAFFTVSIQACCDLMKGGMPLPFDPVPGNALAGGILSIEYQYIPG